MRKKPPKVASVRLWRHDPHLIAVLVIGDPQLAGFLANMPGTHAIAVTAWEAEFRFPLAYLPQVQPLLGINPGATKRLQEAMYDAKIPVVVECQRGPARQAAV